MKEIIEKAEYCLNCQNPQCRMGCPLENHIPDFIAQVKQGDYQKAYEIRINAQDKLTSLDFVGNIMKGIPILNWGESFVNVNGDFQIKGKSLLGLIFPIGSTYITQENTNPNTILGFGTWERLKGKVVVGLDENDTDFNTIGKTGGEKEHTLVEGEIPNHALSINIQHTDGEIEGDKEALNCGLQLGGRRRGMTGYYGGGQAHNNLQPYQVVGYMWIRTN